jgi:hypothetical protein
MQDHGHRDAARLCGNGEEVVERIRSGDGFGGSVEDDAARGRLLEGGGLDERVL